MTPKKALARRLELLESHLRAEHPNLLAVIPTFAPSTWRPVAWPRSCHVSSQTWAIA